mmetsp:Transcript_28105/g.63615  ORF Transcript_28105/g.63615 Transcript_28105/m.63615 type:complete len:240 (+) Transcript_28105:390-1109(+)
MYPVRMAAGKRAAASIDEAQGASRRVDPTWFVPRPRAAREVAAPANRLDLFLHVARPRGQASNALLLLQHCADPVGEDVAERLPDELRVAMHQVDKERVEALQVLHKLRLVEFEDALQQQHHVRRDLLQDGLGGVALLRARHRQLVQLEIVAKHVQAERDEPVLGRGGDQQHVLIASQGRHLALFGWGQPRLNLREKREEYLQVVPHCLELHVKRLLVDRLRRVLEERCLQHTVRLVVH